MDTNETYDVVVVGGGAAGPGVVLAAADGMMAGAMLDAELILEETAAAVPQHRKDAA
jgi:glycerol-3-phosphate dehydrogenase